MEQTAREEGLGGGHCVRTFLPKEPRKQMCVVVTCNCPKVLPSEQEYLPTRSLPWGRSKALISFEGIATWGGGGGASQQVER